MTDRRIAGAVLGLALLAVMACGPLGNLGNMVTGGGAGSVASLWPDVPPYPGAEKVDLEMPLALRVAVGTAMQAVRSQAEGANVEDLEYIAYSTNDSADQIQAFYTNERMADEGWLTDQSPGCGGAGAEMESLGAMCVFAKETTTQASALFVIATPGDNGESVIFYMRADGEPAAK